MGEDVILIKREQSCVDSEMSKNENTPKMKTSSNISNYVKSTMKQILRKYKKALMEVIRHDAACFNCHTRNSVGNMEFVLKVKDKNKGDNKLVGISACEENTPYLQ